MRLVQYWDKDPPEMVTHWMNGWSHEHRRHSYFRLDDFKARQLLHAYPFSVRNAFDRCELATSKSNILRYSVLSETGVWADADIQCLQSVLPLWDRTERAVLVLQNIDESPVLPVTGFVLRDRTRVQIRNDFLMFRRYNDPLLLRVRDIAVKNVINNSGSNSWEMTGPGIWNNLYETERELFAGIEFINFEDQQYLRYHPSPAKRWSEHKGPLVRRD